MWHTCTALENCLVVKHIKFHQGINILNVGLPHTCLYKLVKCKSSDQCLLLLVIHTSVYNNIHAFQTASMGTRHDICISMTHYPCRFSWRFIEEILHWTSPFFLKTYWLHSQGQVFSRMLIYRPSEKRPKRERGFPSTFRSHSWCVTHTTGKELKWQSLYYNLYQ